MVRKWSYVTNTTNSVLIHEKSAVVKCHSFKVFRMTTRFKKYQRYKTTFVRKKDSTRKRQTSWFTLTVVLGQWSLQYLKNRQHLRYIQSNELSSYKLSIPNTYVITKKLPLLSNSLAFTTMRISTKFFPQAVNNILINEINVNVLKDTNVNNLVCENHLFSETDLLDVHKNFNFSWLTHSIFNWHLSYILEIYKILILLTLMN